MEKDSLRHIVENATVEELEAVLNELMKKEEKKKLLASTKGKSPYVMTGGGAQELKRPTDIMISRSQP